MKTIKLIASITILGLLFANCNKDEQEVIEPNPDQEEEVASLIQIDSISPNSGPRFTPIDIYGKNFGTDLSKVRVFFPEDEANILVATDTIIIVNVPISAGSGPIKLRIDESEIEGPDFFYDNSPWVDVLAGGFDVRSEDGLGMEAGFYFPDGIAVDRQDNLYVADALNHRIRKISPEGRVSTLAGSTPGNEDGIGVGAKFSYPRSVAVDKDGNVYVSDNGNHTIRKITPDGVVTTFAGSKEGDADGNLSTAKFNSPQGIAIDANGNIVVVDTGNHKIKKITSIGAVVTIAGSTAGFEDGNALDAQFNYPAGTAIGNEGTIYIADTGNNRIRTIDTSGNVSTLAGTLEGSNDGTRFNASFNLPEDITVANDGSLYVTDSGNHRIRKVTPDGEVSTYAGSSIGSANGTITQAQFNGPKGIAFDSRGRLFVVDSDNSRIRVITQE